MNDNKIETSVQYQFTNVRLFNEIFSNWTKFHEILNSGPEKMKEYLFLEWNKVADELKKNDKLIIKDINRKVTRDNFNITFNTASNNIFIFYFSFPDYEYKDGTSKYIALAMTPDMPRYFTLEYGRSILQEKDIWFIGEFYLEDGKRCHKNYRQVDNIRLSYFSGYIQKLLESEYKIDSMNKQVEFEKLLSSALAGDKESYNKLGYFYETGYGTQKNYCEAIKWYFKAVECKIYSSYMVRLALLYENGTDLGIQNYKVAFTLLSDAARHNIRESYFFLGTLYMNGLGTETDYNKALNYFKLVTQNDAGYIHAQFQIGNIYEYGDEKLRDFSKAMEYYEKNNLPIAKNRLAFLYLLQNCETNIDIIKTKYLQSYKSGNLCEKYNLDILNELNGRKIKVIDNLSELNFDELSNEYGAILIKTENSCKDLNTLYSIDEIKKLKEKMKIFLSDIDDLNEDKNNELDVFMQIYVKIGKQLNYDFDTEKRGLNSDNGYQSRNLINALLHNKCVCGGFIELLRNSLESKGIDTRLVFSASHVFLQVCIEKNWYYVDITTDSQFIKNDKTMQYCLLSEKDMTNMHINHDKFVKSCEVYPSVASYPKETLVNKYYEIIEGYNNER